ncbi:three-Cys-motif partner protein TcmP [Patescibacteria group bacterium]|nr:three-Cys-motif partner protein TcmP [Patescibacteria group bacterium]
MPVEPTIWDLDPHTKAKHEILRYYLGGWFPILARYAGRIVYIDGFAGPGVYSKGEEGSPVIALRTAYEHVLRPQFRAELVFLFIESRKDRAEKLKEVLQEKFPDLPEKIKYWVISDEFEPTIERFLEELEKEKAKLAPTFAFIDPFGFTGFSMDLLKRLLRHNKCEVLITFMAGFIKRFLDELREPALDSLFSTDEWRKIRDIDRPKERPLLELYERQLREVCGINYTRSFEMIGENNQLMYYMIFGTKHWKGLKVMKEAMWNVDGRGLYSFSDRLGREQRFLTNYQDEPFWIPSAAEEVYNKFKGQTISVEDIEKFIIIEIEYIFRKSILIYIEDNNPERIADIKGRRKRRSFPAGCIITFS